MIVKEVTGKTAYCNPSDAIVKCNCGSNAITVHLGNVKNFNHAPVIKKTDSSANAVTILSAKGETLDGGTYQVETATVAGTITTSGNMSVVITASEVVGSPVTISVPISAGESTSTIASRVRSYIEANKNITDIYSVSGSGANIVLTQRQYLGNDSTLNISLDNDTSEGLTQAATSTNTTAGVSVTLSTENEYKSFAPMESGWVMIDSGGENKTETLVNKTLTSPVLTTPKIDDGDAGVSITSANQTHASATVTIPNIGDAADEFVMKDTAQTVANKILDDTNVIDGAEIRVNEGTPVNAVASSVTITAGEIALIDNGDTVEFVSSTFTRVGSDPGTGEFTDAAGLAALLGAIEGWDATSDGSVTVTATTKGTSGDGNIVTITKAQGVTAGGSEAAKAAVTIPAATLAALSVGDTVTFDSVVFTKASATSVEDDEFADTAGLIQCIDAMEDWVATLDGSDIDIEAAEVGAAYNDKTITVVFKRTTDNGVDGTVGAKGEILVDTGYIYICTAANTVADANWKKAAIA